MNEDTEGIIQNATLNTYFSKWENLQNNDSKCNLVNNGSATQGFISKYEL